MRKLFFAVPAIVAASGCVASRSDVQTIRNDIAVMRVERFRSDSANQAELTRVINALRAASDSISALGTRLGREVTTTEKSFATIQQQLLQIQELTGQSEQRLQEVRASLEERAQSIAVATGDTAAAGSAAGPNQIFQIGRDQLVRGSNAAAREAFVDLLTKYPISSLAADAQFYIGESFAAEGNGPAADSAYAAVVAKYPKAPRAATALYKRAVAAESGGRTRAAQQLYQELIRKYPASDEAALARERIRAPR